jgi:hypothetical protein
MPGSWMSIAMTSGESWSSLSSASSQVGLFGAQQLQRVEAVDRHSNAVAMRLEDAPFERAGGD